MTSQELQAKMTSQANVAAVLEVMLPELDELTTEEITMLWEELEGFIPASSQAGKL